MESKRSYKRTPGYKQGRPIAEPLVTEASTEVGRPEPQMPSHPVDSDPDSVWIDWAWNELEGLKSDETLVAGRVHRDVVKGFHVALVSSEAKKYLVPMN